MAALRAVQALCVLSLGGVFTTPRGYCQYFLTYGAKKIAAWLSDIFCRTHI